MPHFVGRQAELAVLRDRGAEARAGRPRIVQVQGPPGIGKTALVERFLADPGPGPEPVVVRASGEETETLLVHGVVEQLARSAGAAGGPLAAQLRDGSPVADPVTIGTRILEMLDELEAAGPVVVVVDDVHWADLPSLQALIFALRRLEADPVLVVLAVRADALAALPASLRRLVTGRHGSVLRLDGLAARELSELAERMDRGALPAPLAGRLHRGTRGNPLHARALLEEFAPAEWGPSTRPLPSPRSFRLLVRDRYQGCAAPTRRLVDAVAVLGARVPLPQAAALGEVTDPLAAAEEAGSRELLETSAVRAPWVLGFTHPLVRSAVLDALGPARRSALHAAAAALVSDEAGALHHRTAAAPAPDAELAHDLAAFAEREARRQAWPGAIAQMLDAARLTPDPAEGRRRLLRAVDWMLRSGDAARAAGFDEVRGFPADPLRDGVLGSLAMARGEAVAAEELLTTAWWRCGPDTDPEVAAMIALQNGVHRYGRLDAAASVDWCRRALALTGPATVVRRTAETYLAHGLGQRGATTESFAAAASAEGGPAGPGSDWLQPRSARGLLRLVEDDLDGARADLASVAAAATERDAHNLAAFALASLARTEFLAGHWAAAVVHADRALAVSAESEYAFSRLMVTGAAVLVPAARGEWAAAEALLAGPAPRPSGDYERSVTAVALARAALAEARGEHRGVLDALAPVLALRHREAVDEPGFWPWADLYAEALAGVGRHADADQLLAPHEARAAARGRRSATARLARARGRVEAAAGRRDRAQEAFERALAAVAQLPMPFERAKTALAAGAFLRRIGQRRRAVDLLGEAGSGFAALGAEPWVQRCASELAAAGVPPPGRWGRDRLALTPQELVVARLAADGLTNREIAGQLVVSIKTVEYHLRNAFRKLGIARRRELPAALAVPCRP